MHATIEGMPATSEPPDLWSLVYGKPWVDPRTLLAAIERELRGQRRDFRTRLLLRDSLTALERRWGAERLNSSLPGDLKEEASRIKTEDLGEPGFPTLEQRMADAIDPQTLLLFFREIGEAVRAPARLVVGGSSALILRGLLSRPTEDVDVVDEVPAAIRAEHDLLRDVTARYGLSLTHFQSHYLPSGWDLRIASLGRFGKLDVFLVDPIDIFVGKLFSKRTKDRDDLRMLMNALDRQKIVERLASSAQGLIADPILRGDAERNWYVLYGDALPA
jgi:hypothetical protein